MIYVLLSISKKEKFTSYDIETEILEIDAERHICQFTFIQIVVLDNCASSMLIN